MLMLMVGMVLGVLAAFVATLLVPQVQGYMIGLIIAIQLQRYGDADHMVRFARSLERAGRRVGCDKELFKETMRRMAEQLDTLGVQHWHRRGEEEASPDGS